MKMPNPPEADKN